jgi:DNA-binding NarL/FixJ family response regulator
MTWFWVLVKKDVGANVNRRSARATGQNHLSNTGISPLGEVAKNANIAWDKTPGSFFPNTTSMRIPIGVADDQRLFMNSLSALIDTFPSFEVVLQALNGQDLLQQLEMAKIRPDILLVDVNMPLLDGPRAVQQIQETYPLIRMAALSMKDDDATVIRMIKAGCCAFLLKDISDSELERALLEISDKGFYNADQLNLRARKLVNYQEPELTNQERQFVQLACSDLTYKQIAGQMYLSERTIDGYRESVFDKLKVQSRVGMVLEAIKRQIVTL